MARWMERLSKGADALFRHGEPAPGAFIHSAIADAFVASLDLQPIGFNWELLDAQASADATRSALGELTKALSHDIENPGKPWLDAAQARQCAEDFLSLFDFETRSVVSNRYDGLWNPISGRTVEWGFVGFDSSRIAILLLSPK